MPEIWAYGVRNPWGMHFDGATLWFGDVGQDRWEEIDVGKAGANYGWNVMEGRHCYKADTCDATPYTAPVAEYGHDVGHSVTGGVVYRGKPSIPAIDGRYVYGDFADGLFWSLATDGGEPTLLGHTDLHPSAFGTDRDGRLYIAGYNGRIVRADP
jgi:glucose/arabinose dehydrogenase